MEYKVITFQGVFSSTKALEELVKAVNEAITHGWEPLGGVAMSDLGYAQTMIKRR